MRSFTQLQRDHKDYLKSLGFSKRTFEGYDEYLTKFIAYLKEQEISQVTDLTKDILHAYQMAVSYRSKKDGALLSNSTRRKYIESVRSFLRYLVKTGALISDLSIYIELPKKVKHLPRDIMTKREVLRLLNQPNPDRPLGLRNKAILELLYSTGIRNEELRNLDCGDVSLTHGELRINEGKNAKDRVVPLGDIAVACLRQYMSDARPILAANLPLTNNSPRRPSSSPELFLSKNGRRLTSANLITMIQKYAERAHIKKNVSPHTIRHTCATHLLKNRAHIRHIQVLLGHASLESTQIYTRVELSDLKRIHRQTHPREQQLR